jgi:RNA polymerase sigma-70 factor (ECF subfamily)
MEMSRPEELGDESLVVQAQKGDRKAFEELVERYKQKAYRIAFDFTRDREEAKDLSQEAFLRAFTHLDRFDKRSTFYTWLYRILVNLCLDHRRRGQRVAWQTFEEKDGKMAEEKQIANPTSSPERQTMSGEISRKIGAALKLPPSKQRTAFLLKNHEGLSIREIAKVMQTAEGTVKTHIHRAVTALRQSLAELV